MDILRDEKANDIVKEESGDVINGMNRLYVGLWGEMGKVWEKEGVKVD